MSTYNCLFCPEKEISKADQTDPYDWICNGCQTIYAISHYLKLGDIEIIPRITWYQFSVDYKDSYVQFEFILNRSDGDLCWVRVGGRETILELHHIPNITPFNALQKIPLLLTFN